MADGLGTVLIWSARSVMAAINLFEFIIVNTVYFFGLVGSTIKCLKEMIADCS